MPSISIPHLYSIWFMAPGQLRPDDPDTRITNYVFLITGMLQERSVHLSKIARMIPVRAKKLSLTRRLERVLANGAIRPREWYCPVAQQLVAAAGMAGQVHLIIDGSKVGAGHQLLMIAIAYKDRALPLAWTWVRHKRGHSTVTKQIAPLRYVKSLLPDGIQVSLTGHTPVIVQLNDWHWDYALRQYGRNLVQITGSDCWVRLDGFLCQTGELMGLGLTKLHACPTHLTLYWAKGKKHP